MKIYKSSASHRKAQHRYYFKEKVRDKIADYQSKDEPVPTIIGNGEGMGGESVSVNTELVHLDDWSYKFFSDGRVCGIVFYGIDTDGEGTTNEGSFRLENGYRG